MHVPSGEIVETKDIPYGQEQEYITVGDIVEIRGYRFRVTGMKPNGRLFLKRVKP